MTSDRDKAYPKAASGKPVALEKRNETEDGRRYSPSSARNRQPILEAFRELSLDAGNVLEIASGTGEHGAYLTGHSPRLSWTYSDIDPPSLVSQAAWRDAAGHDRLSGPLTIDASLDDWGDAESAGPFDTVFSANMVHIAPFAVVEGLVAGAGRLLKPGGRLVFYGPFARHGEIVPSNAAFSESLQARDPAWGVRDLDADIMPLAEQAGLRLQTIVDMPANNLCVVFAKTG